MVRPIRIVMRTFCTRQGNVGLAIYILISNESEPKMA